MDFGGYSNPANMKENRRDRRPNWLRTTSSRRKPDLRAIDLQVATWSAESRLKLRPDAIDGSGRDVCLVIRDRSNCHRGLPNGPCTSMALTAEG